MPTISPIWNQTKEWFRDHAQANRVAGVIIHRLADDRIPNECRYLVRLKWHFHMGYEEVSYDELQQNVSDSKMALLDDLFVAIADHNFKEIDEWAARCETHFPVVEDKWFIENGDETPQD